MTSLAEAYQYGCATALEKFAATRAMREIRNAVGQGTPAAMSRANRIATTPGVLSPGNTMGSEIKDLGRAGHNAGSEGLATLVAHPQHGVAVRKMFDPNAQGYSPTLIQRKQQLGSLPGTAAHLGATQTMYGTPVHFNEYVQGRSAASGTMSSEQQKQYMSSALAAQRGARQQGLQLRDLRPENAVLTPGGQARFIDHMPFKPSEISGNAQVRQLRKVRPDMRHAIVNTDEGATLFPGPPAQGYAPEVSSAHPAQFKQYMLSGNATPAPSASKGPAGTELLPPPSYTTPVTPRPNRSHTGLSEMLGMSNLAPDSATSRMMVPPR